MKHNWEYKRLGEVFKTTSGGTPLKGNSEYYEGGDIPWLRSGEVCKKDITSSELFITQKAVDESSAKFVPSNSVVMAMYGATAAQVGILRKSMTTNQAICSIFPKEGYSSDFLYYYLSNQKCSLLNRAYGAAQPNISQTIIKSIPIPIISAKLQDQIVAELDKLNEMIATRKEQLKELDNLAQSLFYDTFGDPISNPKGWNISALGLICKLSAGGDKPADTEQEYSEEKCVPIYSNGTANEGLYGYTSKAKILQPSLTISGRGTIGVPFIRNKPFVPIIRLIVATPSTQINLNYLYHLIKILKLGGNGASIPQLTVPMIKDLFVPVPPLPIQQQFASQVEAIERQKEIVEASISELQTLLDSRMDYWFN